MAGEIDTLWALVAGLLLLFANVGAVIMLEGLTRRRRVLTVSARHLASVGGSVIGVIAITRFELDLFDSTATLDSDFDESSQLWVAVCSAMLLTTLAMGGMAERASVLAHLLGGLLVGAVLAPVAASARQSDGLLTTIEIGEHGFVDTSAASIFVVAGLMALVGSMIIGPRRGRAGSNGAVRDIPGESIPLAMIGGLVMASTLFGVLARPGDVWSQEITEGALVMVAGGAAGVLAGVVIGRIVAGYVRSKHVLHGLLAGIVSTTGNPLEVSREEAVIFGLVGASIALFVGHYLDSKDIDDPAGIISVFGAAGVWGSLAIGITNGEQFVAQLVGVAVIGAGVIIASGFLFAALRLLRVFRISPDIEVAGIEL